MTFFDRNGYFIKPGSNKNLQSILHDPELKYAVDEYLIIQNEFSKNKSLKDNVVFRACFFELYDMYIRRNTLLKFCCRDGFFQEFENVKRATYANWENRYKGIVRRLRANNYNTVKKNINEWVFASKMLHTIDTNMPIIDSHIEKSFRYANIRVNRRNYVAFKNKFENYMATDPQEVNMIVNGFNAVFPNAIISPVKVIDFVLWMADK